MTASCDRFTQGCLVDLSVCPGLTFVALATSYAGMDEAGQVC